MTNELSLKNESNATLSEETFTPELPNEFVPETPQEKPITQMDELITIFTEFKNKQEAMAHFKANIGKVGDEEKYRSPEGKYYSHANVRKCIKRCEDRQLWKDATQTIEPIEATYKMDNPQPTYNQPEPTNQPNPTPTPQPTYTPTEQQQTPQQQQQYKPVFQQIPQSDVIPVFTPPNPDFVKTCKRLAARGVKIPLMFDDPTGKIAKVWATSEEDLDLLGYDIAVLASKGGKVMNPETLAWIGIGSFVISNVVATAPEMLTAISKMIRKKPKTEGVN